MRSKLGGRGLCSCRFVIRKAYRGVAFIVELGIDGGGSSALVVGQFNGTGTSLDLAVANNLTANVMILTDFNGFGFDSQVVVPVGVQPLDIAAAQIAGDAKTRSTRTCLHEKLTASFAAAQIALRRNLCACNGANYQQFLWARVYSHAAAAK